MTRSRGKSVRAGTISLVGDLRAGEQIKADAEAARAGAEAAEAAALTHAGNAAASDASAAGHAADALTHAGNAAASDASAAGHAADAEASAQDAADIAASIGGAIQNENITYAFNAGDTVNSLAHKAGVIGRTYTTSFFDANAMHGSTSLYQCVGIKQVGDITGNLIFQTPDIILCGATHRFKKILQAEEDIASYGVKLDGVAINQAPRVGLAKSAAELRRHKLTGAGVFLVASAADKLVLGDTWLDLGSVTVQEGAAGVATDLIALAGSNIGSVRETTVRAHGINVVPNPGAGEFDFQGVKSQATGVVIGPDRNGNSPRHIHVNRLKVGCRIEGDFEKQAELKVIGSANGLLFDEHELVGVGSPDTNVVYLEGQLNKQILITSNSTSGHYKIAHEGRIDDGTFITETYLAARNIPTPAIWVRSGKFHWIDISEFRGNNGRVVIFVDKDYADGVDTMRCDGTFVHNYGVVLWVDRCQRLTGAIVISDNDNGRANYSATVSDYLCPAVRINQVYDVANFRPVVQGCSNREGYRIGDAVNGLYPVKVDFTLAGAMRGIDVNGQPSGPNGRTGYFPKDKNLLYVERMDGGSVDFPSIDGSIELGAGAQNVSLRLPAAFVEKGYGIVDNGYQTHIEIVGRTKFSHIGHKSFLSGGKTVSVGALLDYDAAQASWKADRWITSRPWFVTTADLERATSDINWKFKKSGMLAFNSTTNKLMSATGSGKYDVWQEVAGASVITPIDNPLTAALVARMTVAPTTKWREIYDRILNDWAPYWTDMGRFHLLGAHDRQAARLCWKDAANNMVEHGVLAWTAGRGYKGSGSGGLGYLSSAFVPGSIGETNQNIFVGAHVLSLGVTTNGDTVGSDNKAVRLRAAHTNNNRAEVGTTAITSWTTSFTEPRSLAASINTPGTMKVWDNGVLRTTFAHTPSPLPTSIDVLRGYDVVNALYRYGDEEVMLVYYGKNPTDDMMARAASLADDISYMTGAL